MRRKPFSFHQLRPAPIPLQKQWAKMSPIDKGINRIMRSDFDRDGVPNRWDCSPRNPKKDAWDVKEARRYGNYVTYMSPKKYLAETGIDVDDPASLRQIAPDVYRDEETGVEDISKLGKHIKGTTKVYPPYFIPKRPGYEHVEHEGRHRAYAAMLIGEKKIPVSISRPSEHTSESVKKEFFNRTGLITPRTDNRYHAEWDERFERGIPERYMGPEYRKVYFDILRERGMNPTADPAVAEDYPLEEDMEPFDEPEIELETDDGDDEESDEEEEADKE